MDIIQPDGTRLWGNDGIPCFIWPAYDIVYAWIEHVWKTPDNNLAVLFYLEDPPQGYEENTLWLQVFTPDGEPVYQDNGISIITLPENFSCLPSVTRSPEEMIFVLHSRIGLEVFYSMFRLNHFGDIIQDITAFECDAHFNIDRRIGTNILSDNEGGIIFPFADHGLHYAQRVDSTGTTAWSVQISEEPDDYANINAPKLLPDPYENSWYFIYGEQEFTTSLGSLFLTKLSESGDILIESVELLHNPRIGIFNVLPHSEGFYVVYGRHDVQDDISATWVSSFNYVGEPLWDANGVLISDYSPIFHDLDTDSDDNLLVLYSGGSYIYAKSISPDGELGVSFTDVINTTPVITDFALPDIYPNPWNDRFMVRFSSPGTRTFSLYNLLGQLVWQNNQSQKHSSVYSFQPDINQTSGVYYLVIKDVNSNFVVPVVHIK